MNDSKDAVDDSWLRSQTDYRRRFQTALEVALAAAIVEELPPLSRQIRL